MSAPHLLNKVTHCDLSNMFFLFLKSMKFDFLPLESEKESQTTLEDEGEGTISAGIWLLYPNKTMKSTGYFSYYRKTIGPLSSIYM